MSQKKVDYYKAGKSTRSKAARKEKIIDRLEILAWILIAAAMVGWIGYSAYVKITATDNTTVLETTFDNSALSDYVNGLSSAETEEETAAEDADAEEESTSEDTETDAAAEETSDAEEEAAAEDTDAEEKSENDSTNDEEAAEDTAEEETAE